MERYRLIQGGIPVAWASGQTAWAEISHYALVYSQDGPVQIDERVRGRWKRMPPLSHPHSGGKDGK